MKKIKKIPLKDVEFIIYNKDMKKYVRQEKGKTTYVSEKKKQHLLKQEKMVKLQCQTYNQEHI